MNGNLYLPMRKRPLIIFAETTRAASAPRPSTAILLHGLV